MQKQFKFSKAFLRKNILREKITSVVPKPGKKETQKHKNVSISSRGYMKLFTM